MLYIHIPFCHHKCTYCAFFSKATQKSKEPYIEALCREITKRKEPQQKVRTLYFGGGTPTLLSIGQLTRITTCLRENFNLSIVEEVTIEANPENLTPEYLQGLRRLGFNRLSIGIQSFNERDLKILNRSHSAEQAIEAIRQAQKAGFSNISIDLIYGLPDQSLSMWQENLSIAKEMNLQHISCYALTVEEGTMLRQQIVLGKTVAPSEEMAITHYDALCEWARLNGFEQYEVSNFCKPGYYSRHNSRYWDRTPYLGFGPAAHSFDGNKRSWNLADIERYIKQDAPFEDEVLSKSDAYNEYIMTALRTSKGINKGLLDTTYKEHLSKSIQKYIHAGLITETATHYKPSQEGLLHADGMASDLFL